MTFSEDVIELTERIHDYREQVADLTERAETAEREVARLTLQVLLQNELIEGHKFLGEANASMRDAALRLAGRDD